MNHHCGKTHGQETEYASFRTNRSPGQPGRTMQSRVRDMVIEDKAAIRHGKEKSLAEVKAGVPPYRQPEVSGAPQCKAKNQTSNHYVRHSGHPLTRILPMYNPERERKGNGCRPEPNPLRQ